MTADDLQESQSNFILMSTSYGSGRVLFTVYNNVADVGVGVGSLVIPKATLEKIRPLLMEIVDELNRFAASEAEEARRAERRSQGY